MRKLKFQNLNFFLLLIFILTTSHSLNAANCTFTNGGGDNDWSNPLNWDCGAIPGNLDDVVMSTGTVILNTNRSVNSLTFSGGSIEGSADLDILSAFSWDGYSTFNGTGTITLTATATGTISGTSGRYLYQPFVNNGNLTHTGADLRFITGSSFQNNGTFNVDGASNISNTTGGAFVNDGILNNNGSSLYTINVSFNQTGTSQLNLNTGSVTLNGGSSSTGGTITIAAGKTLTLQAGTSSFGSGVSFTGAGDVTAVSGTHTVEGNWSVTGETIISGAALIFNTVATITFPSLTMSSGSLKGSSDFTVNSAFNWTGFSNLEGTGTFTMAGTCTTTISGTSSRRLYQAAINDGVLNHTGSDLYFFTGSSFTNNGTFQKEGSGAVYDINVDFNNASGGTIKGVGLLDFANLTNNGIVAPGLSTGTLTYNDDYANGAKLEIEFDGASFDQLVANNDITLSGELEVTFTGVVPGGTYTIITSALGNITGTFDTETIPANYLIQYNATSVQLVENPLPVELIDFKAYKKLESVHLNWETASELENDYFQIERSTDAINFKNIGRISGAGSTSATQAYQYIDEEPIAGKNYYRLKQVDLDEKYNFSKIIEIHFASTDLEVQVFPNPGNGLFFITTNGETGENVKINVYDMQGNLVFARSRPARVTDALNLEHLGNGMYVLELTDENNIPVRKMIVLQR